MVLRKSLKSMKNELSPAFLRSLMPLRPSPEILRVRFVPATEWV
jgi:hypothetical protein